MALNTGTVRLTDGDIRARFGIASDGNEDIPISQELAYQRHVRDCIALVAVDLNEIAEDSRAKSEALTLLETALMWAGKAIHQPSGVK